ncbi:OmpA family protein [Flavobacterium nitrogenifigens]|uniref:WD40-like Beta Propeller Repeat n=1 Tax=Flavobacterium nitrogenifigens TaxID=1617283 RepID=A0A521BHM1_9FLAO|nr:OmpA family protein [Flavobacterium nitrogenifigens]KAF2339645.1 OmpA family protein [Flavobacterium nitrogenifigens]SMO46638.1 WD40-like Beta Propeller Repeat [Flavobacterium nitrogenifigens]
MKKYRLLCLIILNIFCGYAQESKVKSGDKKYDGYAYIDAIKTYERLADKGYKSEDLFKKLGNSYYFNSEFEAASKWYGELFALNPAPEAEYYYRYAQSLKSAGQNDKATAILNEFSDKYKTDSRAKLYKENPNYLEQIKANSGRYKIEDAGINSKYSDYGSFVFKNKIYFASARDTGNFTQRKHKWTGEYFTNIYNADIDPTTSATSKANKIKSLLNSRFHESSIVFTKDGKTAYFSRNNFVNGKKGKDDNEITLVKIYKADVDNEKFSNIIALPFTSDNYSTAHPALSPDEKTLYFASDMPGTIGQSDIYKVSIKGNNSFGSPENLGTPINTEGKETFPYITSENEIYFASDGHPGLGGLDVFVGQMQSNGSINDIQNLGSDINSPKDDFAYTIDPFSKQGYFSSNKDGGQGSDDIYKFMETRALKCLQELNGIVTDSQSSAILPETELTLYENQKIIKSSVSNSKGEYTFSVECGKTYMVRAQKIEYETKEEMVTIGKVSGQTHLPIALDKSICKVTIGDDLGKCFGIKMIYFDLDKYNIRTEAAIDLEKILDVLNQHPTMKLDIRSHTDSRASNQYNLKLSDQRAKATLNWLIKNGVAKNRLTARGYGETQLVNDCSDGVDCSEEQHQMNRRSEFIITGL